MSCRDFTQNSTACRTVTLIEPDSTLLGATSSGSTDRSLDESGSTPLQVGATRVQVEFAVTKASDNIRFEYLYVDALGIPNPADITVVVVNKTQFGFLVDLVGSPAIEGYSLKWRVVVIDITTLTDIDAPESLRVQIPMAVRSMDVTWTVPRSGTTYGFSELRVENLVDPVNTQRAIIVQVSGKTTGGFTVGISPLVTSDNYFLVVRSP